SGGSRPGARARATRATRACGVLRAQRSRVPRPCWARKSKADFRTGFSSGFGEGSEIRESLRVGERQVGEDLAIHLDTRPLEPVDQAAVGEPVRARRRVDARDPQAVA